MAADYCAALAINCQLRYSTKHSMADTPTGPQVNSYQAVRDVLIASLEKGQFITAILAFVFLMICFEVLYFLEPADRAKFVFTFVHPSTVWAWAGHIITILICVTWFFQQRRFRKKTDEEIKRIAEERTKAQNDALAERERVDRLIAVLSQNPLWKDHGARILEQVDGASKLLPTRTISTTEPPLQYPQERGLFDEV